ncbi:hypothetical protein LOTGIDRAFT_175598 [Lottia gigantea]|uniref:CTCK domain-containing protein n=1 Tax=Lottia gigantea TaxID=225164 RepID=V3ZP56_LOTGI|nr:hypothetical protein LOTGIDRAFT_175598 [Lottia gigantea]ESO93183.1 hypothetical protein LOTGIDRAFT_175598 [Lottia gigantea]
MFIRQFNNSGVPDNLRLVSCHGFKIRDSLIILVFLTISASSVAMDLRSGVLNRDKCQIQVVRLTIHPPEIFQDRCASARVVSFGCRGQCHSYSKIDRHNTSRIMRSCNCCEPVRVGIRLAVLPCLNGVLIRTPVKFARQCSCRPCFTSVQNMDINRLQQLLQKTSLRNKLLG